MVMPAGSNSCASVPRVRCEVIKITTHLHVPVTFQTRCVEIFIENWIGDPRSHIYYKFSTRIDRSEGGGAGLVHGDAGSVIWWTGLAPWQFESSYTGSLRV